MRIPLTDLEKVRRDPKAYSLRHKARRSRIAPNPKGKPRLSESIYPLLMRAISELHRSKGSLTRARRHLKRICPPHLRRRKALLEAIDQLDKYAVEFQTSGHKVFRRRDRLVLPLPKRFAAKVSITGEIPRIDLSKSGYTVWLFTRGSVDWDRELRLPLIQWAYSTRLNSEIEDVALAAYDFSSQRYETHQFTKGQIRSAKKELFRLLRQLVPG
jgi:hypothetical protein